MVANSEYLEKIMDLESDRFMNLKYAEPDFKTEAGAILGEYQQGAREPQRFLNEKVREAAFDKHTYRHTTIGYEADVRAMPQAYEYSKSFFERFYRPENVVLVIAGDFDTEKTKALIRKYYAGWKPGYKAPPIEAEPAQTAPRELTVKYPGRTLPIISVNYKAPAWNADRQDGRRARSARADRLRRRTPRSTASSCCRSGASQYARSRRSGSRAIRTSSASRRW